MTVNKLLFLICLISLAGCYSFDKNNTISKERALYRVENFTDIAQSLEQVNFSGNVMIAQGTEIVFQEQFGKYNRELNKFYDANTVFDIGSITKQFVAAAIMKLEEQGKLSVNDTLPVFFNNVPKDKQNITLHHLMTHSSGLRQNFKWLTVYGRMSYSDIPKNAFATKLLFRPGQKFSYSNIGYSLLARIIEKVTGENWEAFIRDAILLPAGLTLTGYRLPKYEEDLLSINYGADQNLIQWIFNLEAESRSVGHSIAHELEEPGERWYEGGGAFLSTQNDMFKWYLAMHQGLILKQSSWKKIHTPHIAENDAGDLYYGYGWSLTYQDEERRITHNGSNGYSFAEFNYYPESEVFIFVSTNNIDEYPKEIVNQIYRFALNSKPE